MELKPHSIPWISDSRGAFAEIFREEVHPGQISALKIGSGQQRGSHYHQRKTEIFVLISGACRVELRNGSPDDPATEFQTLFLDSQSGAFCLRIPPGVHHTFHNENHEPAFFIIHCDEAFDSSDPDTFSEF